MNFTVIFRGKENTQIIYTLAYEPCPIWKQGEEWILNLNPESPYYRPGSVKRLMKETGLSFDVLHENRECCIITDADCLKDNEFQKIYSDLKNDGFSVKVFEF